MLNIHLIEIRLSFILQQKDVSISEISLRILHPFSEHVLNLRQIGVRDEAKMLGGIGPCGRMLCCSTFLGDFEPVSIKMAKDQNLSLNPSKISGLCGRLMCCLKYENDDYEEAKALMPDVGTRVQTPEGAWESCRFESS